MKCFIPLSDEEISRHPEYLTALKPYQHDTPCLRRLAVTSASSSSSTNYASSGGLITAAPCFQSELESALVRCFKSIHQEEETPGDQSR